MAIEWTMQQLYEIPFENMKLSMQWLIGAFILILTYKRVLG